ncbi:MAG: MBL fold metallo-hydrolase [Chitinophagaceae bacterium]|nr:MBL fold metallo-hydrolase [Chitinophagaceae bacterium]
MNRRNFFQSGFFTALAFAAANSGFAMNSDADDWKITMLNKNLGIFTETGGTIAFYLSKDGIIVVDAQFPGSATHLIAELKKKNIPFHLLINTHHHGDHTSGNISFKELTSRVLAHENSLANQKRVAEKNNTADKQYYPKQTFKVEWNESAGDEKINLKYFGPAHTDGDIIVHFEKNNIAHVGDLVFNRRHPFVDRSAGASMQHWVQVLRDAGKHYDRKTVFVCGHSGNGFDVKGNIDMLKDFQEYLENTLDYVSKQIRLGKSKEEILKTTEIPGSPDWKGEGIERPLTAAYEELKS